VSASGRYVAHYDTTNETIVVRDSEGEKKDWTISRPRSELRSVAIAPDGDTVAHAGNDGSIRLSNRTASEPRTLVGAHLLPVTSLAFGPKGHVLASGSEDNTIRLWNVTDGKNKGPPPLRGHEGWVSALAISPDGRFVASGSWDRTVRLWDIDGHAMGIPFRGHRTWVTDVGFDAEGSQIVSHDDSGRVEVWQGGDKTDWLRAACRQLSGQVSRTDDTYTRAHELCARAFPDASTLRKTPDRCVARVDAARAPSGSR
jgi:WD40 repeat protein